MKQLFHYTTIPGKDHTIGLGETYFDARVRDKINFQIRENNTKHFLFGPFELKCPERIFL